MPSTRRDSQEMYDYIQSHIVPLTHDILPAVKSGDALVFKPSWATSYLIYQIESVGKKTITLISRDAAYKRWNKYDILMLAEFRKPTHILPYDDYRYLLNVLGFYTDSLAVAPIATPQPSLSS